MRESKRIADLYRSVYEGDEKGEAWHGIALKPLLADVTLEQACALPLGQPHSILQLVLHVAYWEEITLRRFRGEAVDAPLNTSQDWPENRRVTEAQWRAALQRLDASHRALREAIADCSDEKLGQNVAGRKYDNYVLLHGTIDHCVYHSGQVALAKKAQKG